MFVMKIKVNIQDLVDTLAVGVGLNPNQYGLPFKNKHENRAGVAEPIVFEHFF